MTDRDFFRQNEMTFYPELHILPKMTKKTAAI